VIRRGKQTAPARDILTPARHNALPGIFGDRSGLLPKVRSAANAVGWFSVEAMPIDPNDYYITTSRAGEQPERWSWEKYAARASRWALK
jgi:hypothetical protein